MEERIREVTEQEAESLQPVLFNAFSVNSTSSSKKINLQTSKTPETSMQELLGSA